MLREILVAYAQVKSMRRELRALGLRKALSDVSDDEVKEWRAQMSVLNHAQLAIETIKRHLELQPTLFVANDRIVALLREVEQYVNDGLRVPPGSKHREGRVLHEWEEFRAPHAGSSFRADTATFCSSPGVHRDDERELRAYVSDKLDEIIKLVHSDIYKRPADGDAEPFSVDPSLVDRRTHG